MAHQPDHRRLVFEFLILCLLWMSLVAQKEASLESTQDSALTLFAAAQRTPKISDQIAFYHQLITHWPESPYAERTLFNLGQISLLRGEFLEAIDFFQSLIGRTPPPKEIENIRYALALSFSGAGEFQKAREMFERITPKTPQRYVMARYHLAELLYLEGKHAEAIFAFHDLINKPNLPYCTMLQYLADSYQKIGDDLKASTFLESLKTCHRHS